jgi:hypothetical protein
MGGVSSVQSLTKEKNPERFKKNAKSLRTTDYADATDVGVGSGTFDFL